MHASRSRSLVLVVVLCLAGALPLRADDPCFHTHPNMVGGTLFVDNPGSLNPDGTCSGGYNPNLSPSHYAALYFDFKNKAEDLSCAEGAFQYFHAKLRRNLDYAEAGNIVCSINGRVANPFQGWLAGASIASIYRTAIEAMAKGYAVDDDLLQRVREQVRAFDSPQDLGCGSGPGAGNNSCMDDYAVTALGYGWLAAYEAKRGRTIEAADWAARAQAEIHRAITPVNENGSICFLRKGTNPARCDAGFAELDAGTARVIGANHGQESPSYGFGLMTSIAGTCRALQVARANGLGWLPPNGCAGFEPEEARIARELLLEAQQKSFFVNGDWVFGDHDCFHIGNLNPAHCGELKDPARPELGPNYSPLHSPVMRFYAAMGISTLSLPPAVTDVPRREGGQPYSPEPGPAFQFDVPDPRLFTEADPTAFFGPLRRLFYAEEAFEQWPEPLPRGFVYWIQTAERAGFGAPGSLTVAGGASKGDLLVRMWWRDVTAGGTFAETGSASPTPNGAPWNVWYNSVPGPVDPTRHYQVRVQQGTGPFHTCDYLGRQIGGQEQIWWCQPPVAQFEPICSGTDCQFEDRASPPAGNIASWSWIFGDGTSGSGATTSHGYSAGIYTSRLTVTDSAGRSASSGQQLFLDTPLLDPDIGYSCSGRNCTFTTVHPDNPPHPPGYEYESWTWDPGDGSAPFSTASGTTQYVYGSSGTFTVRLTVTKGGETASTVRHLSVDLAPSASFTVNCAGQVNGRTCVFDSSASSDDLQIAARVFDFGDNVVMSTVRRDHRIEHFYAANGTYTVKLTVTDSGGHKTTTTRTVTVSDQPPVASFTVSCTGRSCSFDGRGSSDDYGVYYWSWVFGDGTSGVGSQVTHVYAADNPNQVAQLTVLDTANQPNSTQRTFPVVDAPPTASFTVSCNGRSCSFDGRTSSDDVGINSWSWSFGDGTTGVGSQTNHLYGSSGNFTVQLTVTDGSNQPNSTTRPASPNIQPTASFTVNCVGRRCDVDGSGSSDDGPLSWSWSFGDGQSGSGATGSHTYAASGNYTITLTVTDNMGATAQDSRPVTALDDEPPFASFYVVCVANRTCAVDAENSADDNGIVTYRWAWGDGQVTSGSNSQPSHAYAGNGPYTIVLTVYDSAGQSDTDEKTVSFDQAPTAFFTMTCIGRSCDFDASGSTDDLGIAGYLWDWDDESLSTDGPLAHHNFPYDGTFTVRLTVTDTTGHTGGYQRTANLVDGPPFASFFVVCVGRTCSVDAENASDDNGVAEYSWNWGDQSPPTVGSNPFPSHTYASSGPYTITLTVTDIVGQTASTSRQVTVDLAPTATFTLQCAGRSCDVNANGSSDPDGTIASYFWDWGDERLSTGGPMNHHDFEYDGSFDIVLTVYDNTGNTARFQETYDTLGGEALQASFAPTCSMLECQFDASRSTASPAVESYSWEWGDGGGDAGQALERHQFAQPGEYTVTLTVADNAGRTHRVSKRLALRAEGTRRHTPGTARLDTPMFRLRASNEAASETTNAAVAGAKGRPLAGDWDGDGIDTIGRYDDETSTFRLRDANKPGPAQHTFVFGPPGAGWLPLVGDWDGDGVDTVGLYDAETGTFHLRNSNAAGPADESFGFLEFGAGWRPLAGDWDGDGIDTVGLYDPGTGGFYLRTSNSTGRGPDLSFVFAAPDLEGGGAPRQPIVGDWNGDGWDSIGVWDAATDRVYLRNWNSSGAAEIEYEFGARPPHGSRERMVAGDWEGL